MEVKFHLFLTLALDRGECLTSRPDSFTPEGGLRASLVFSIIIIIVIIIIIIIIIIYCNWVVTRWQWLFYMYIKHEIDYKYI